MRAPAVGDCVMAMAMAMAMATLTACKGKSDVAPDSQARGPTLAVGVRMAYGSGGGFSGETNKITVFADGHVEREGSRRKPAPPAHIPVARVEKLGTDLEATGVFAQKDGSWAPEHPVADGVGSSLVVRDKADVVHAYSWDQGATAPDAVVRAMKVGGELAEEVDRQNPAPPCACRAGDPLCSCL